MIDKSALLAKLVVFGLPSALAMVSGFFALLMILHSVPPHATLTIQRGELVDVRLVAPPKAESWIRLRLLVGDHEVSAAVRRYELLQKVADVSAILRLSPGTRLTLYTSEPYSSGLDSVLGTPNIWQIETDTGTVLSYAVASDVWQKHRRMGIIGFSFFSGAPLALVCYLAWPGHRATRNSPTDLRG